MASRQIAIVGAGIGGMAAAIALHQRGISVAIFEQAQAFRRIGAAINLTPNAVRVLDGLGIGQHLRAASFSPEFRVSRTWDTGEETLRLEMGELALRKYGSPQLMVHRADLLSALESALPPGAVHLNSKLVRVDQTTDGVTIHLEDGTQKRFDGLIAADGIHSTVRQIFFEAPDLTYTGMVAYRDIFPTARLEGYEYQSFVKWWGPTLKSQLVTAAINNGEELFVFATKEEPEISRESWSAKADIEDLRAAFASYHPDARRVLAECQTPLKTALYVRAPLRNWETGRVALLGDACHAMVPFMAQGAAMCLEDAAVLARCLERDEDIASSLKAYVAVRKQRASRIQQASTENEWLRSSGNADWVYGYDAWDVPIDSLFNGLGALGAD
ncbi:MULTISPECIES: FAD-dependent monooxygenase [unclassified Beijerinckia]|uniref:FAD-dependent monooxygenase n=1 Tax=unclassified Beijerinckia TaxID=2638183 RepID=UPI00089B6F20|nr:MULTISPECIES: FAD-dependent monooxygenase [unclassified Beijerinckia]MDH7799097.1 salicylate hydroxylase [Beijerinckia sp. GAS462]SED95161.1 salicylate hydroxylase [Beijerinckia sp. 28-YEA-48]